MRRAQLFVVALVWVGCGGTEVGGGDGGGSDAAMRIDASADGGTAIDGGLDATVELDAEVRDAATDIDAATEDAATDIDAMTADAAADIDATTADAATDAGVDAPMRDVGPPDARDGATCGTTVETYVPIASPHVAVCSAITYPTSPPTSGPHYPRWPAYRTYDAPIAHGFMVHGLEHGAVVITYDCETACDDEVAALEAYVAALPRDPRCTTRTPHQVVIAPDPTLGVRFAAAAWGVALRSDCFDLEALGTFIAEHTGHGPEDICADGDDILDPTSGIPAGCGL